MWIILRHAEPRRTELDPELTSHGHRMAREAAGWAVAQLPPDGPVRVIHTPTARTRQTAEAVAEWLGERATLESIHALPETFADLDMLADRFSGARPGLPHPDLPPCVLVGHHTTLVGLARELPAGVPTPDARNHAAGVALQRTPGSPPGWRPASVWRGQRAGA